MPIFSFAFFFENILIPVSKAFIVKDDNGSMAMNSSIISLAISCAFYATIVPLISQIKSNYGMSDQFYSLYLTVYMTFNLPFAIITHALMAILAFLQSICFF